MKLNFTVALVAITGLFQFGLSFADFDVFQRSNSRRGDRLGHRRCTQAGGGKHLSRKIPRTFSSVLPAHAARNINVPDLHAQCFPIHCNFASQRQGNSCPSL